MLAVFLRLREKILRNLLFLVCSALRLFVVEVGFHLDQIDDTGKQVTATDRKLDRHRVGAKPFAHHRNDVVKIGPHTVHLVDKSDTRDLILVCLPPDRLRLGLNTTHRTKNTNGAVENPKAPFDFNGEVNVSRRVDDVHSMVVPESSRRGRGNRNPPLLLLLHPVHNGRAIVHFAHAMRLAGIEQHPLSERCFTRIDVGHDADVANFIEWYQSCHFILCPTSPATNRASRLD